MPNGRPGDNPITDLLAHGMHPFPPDIEALILKVYARSPTLLDTLGDEIFDWMAGRNLEQARETLLAMLDQKAE